MTAKMLFLYQRLGHALIAAQRVEYVCKELVNYLAIMDKQFYGLTMEEFLDSTEKGVKSRMMLGEVFKLLKLNPTLVPEQMLSDYLKKRNELVHNFWKDYVSGISKNSLDVAIDFCNEFRKQSNDVESFFKGFLYFLHLRFKKHIDEMDDTPMKTWKKDFHFFLKTVPKKEIT